MANITLGQFYNAIREGAREGTLEAQKELFENGQAGVTLYGPNGQPISSSNRISVEATLTGQLDSEVIADNVSVLADSSGWAGGITTISSPCFGVTVRATAIHAFEVELRLYGPDGSMGEERGYFFADFGGVIQTPILPSRSALVRVRITNHSDSPQSYDVTLNRYTGIPEDQLRSFSSHVTFEGEAVKSNDRNETVFCKHIVFLANEGDDDLLFNFDRRTDKPGAVRLRPGEILNDVSLVVTRLFYRSVEGTQPFRFMGVR